MDEQEKQQFEQMKQQLNTALEFIESLKTSNSIPFDVDGALRDRLGLLNETVSPSSKSASSENTTADGVSVLQPPDGFVELRDFNNNFLGFIPKYD